MRLVADSGSWTAGPAVSEAPAVAVLEVSGAVLAWTVDGPTDAASTRLTVTDVAAADWLWRVMGPVSHAAVVAGADSTEFSLAPNAFEPLRRLAIGHWLRRWWPESRRDGIPPLDRALLDGELAVLTEATQEFFTEDTLDSDVEGLLAPHRTALLALERHGDPRVAELARACVDLAEDAGAWLAMNTTVPHMDSDPRRREDYALAAGGGVNRTPGVIAQGVGSIDWASVPSGTFDAADHTIEWSVAAADGSVLATVRVALAGAASARGVDVRLHSGDVSGSGMLDANGTGAFALARGVDQPLTENQAWDHDWSASTVGIGAKGTGGSGALRQRVRAYARARLARPGPDAFLAEIMAAESDY